MALRVICTGDVFDRSWRWIAHRLSDPIHWSFSFQGSSWLERKIQRPHLAMIWNACRVALRLRFRSHDLLVTHDPRVAFWIQMFCWVLRVHPRHVAHSFNFPVLPTGFKRTLMAFMFRRVWRFVCFSSAERQLYADWFGLPVAKFDVVLWGIQPPKPEPKDEPLHRGRYVVALGGNGRDYVTLMAAAAALPDVPFVAVLRRNNLARLDVPPNVKVYCDIPIGQAANLLAYAEFMVLPLRDSEVPCGHLTLVAAMHAGKAMVVTDSVGVRDYVRHEHNALLVAACDRPALSTAIHWLWDDPQLAAQLARNGRQFAREFCTESSTVEHFERLLADVHRERDAVKSRQPTVAVQPSLSR